MFTSYNVLIYTHKRYRKQNDHHSINAAVSILYNYVVNNDIIVIVPNAPIQYTAIPGHGPDILDIALVRTPTPIK